jgi:hypothetical protein
MIRKSWLRIIGVGMVVFGAATICHADTVISNFEDSTLDQWGTDGGPGETQFISPSYSQSTTGVTLGSHSLAVTQPAGSDNYWGPSTGNLVSQGFLTALTTAPRLAYDLTMYGSDIFTEDNPSASNFAQSNELLIEISWASGGALTTKGSTFLQQSVASNHGNATDSLMAIQTSGGQWNGVDGTRTISWDLSKFSMTVTGFGNGNFRTFLSTFFTQIRDVKFDFVQQVGDMSSDSHNYGSNDDPLFSAPPDTFFFDNVRLVPEPVSVGGIVMLSVLALRRRR